MTIEWVIGAAAALLLLGGFANAVAYHLARVTVDAAVDEAVVTRIEADSNVACIARADEVLDAVLPAFADAITVTCTDRPDLEAEPLNPSGRVFEVRAEVRMQPFAPFMPADVMYFDVVRVDVDRPQV